MDEQQGLIAILDALGAAAYGEREIHRFLESRAKVLKILREKAHAQAAGDHLDERAVSVFTFNDTVLIVLRTGAPPNRADVERFGLLLRKFLIDSLLQGILFRGSMSIGKFYVEEESNTVMGAAVTDAAAWYDAADWIGINATPHASMLIDSLLDKRATKLDRVLVDYEVPFKDGARRGLKAVNWPKGFYVRGMRPDVDAGREKAKLLALLASHGVPRGAERKHSNAVAFFDHCVALLKKAPKSTAV